MSSVHTNACISIWSSVKIFLCRGCFAAFDFYTMNDLYCILLHICISGEKINNEDSVYYWAWKNNIPVFSPALTDGSLGDMIFFHSFKNPGLILDIVDDLRQLNTLAMRAKKSGMIILGGGLIKHHICNANLMVRAVQYAPKN